METGNLVSNHVSGLNLRLSDLMTDEHDSEVDSVFPVFETFSAITIFALV